MAELTTLARPYAKAAFGEAHQHGSIDSWGESLAFAGALAADRDMQQVLAHPELTGAEKVAVLCDCFSDPVTEPFRNFLTILSDNRRLLLLPQVAALFQALRAEQDRTVDVTLTSPYELSDEQQQKLKEALAKRLDRQVSLTADSDESLIGGLVIRAGDTVIDASVRGRLNRLSETLLGS
ncbi:F0F1 ATP synthase subunit delta [Tamilnaduibacter salinus]|uniref:ATP synthase subunit delta n=1 Tax=Tamilnaduibacter salinus TaxID=1484056 RepID=A0A2A2I653_9GAMM|nr:F0F1 ATP synthase subunit delta [Tamilnaduibacter salinus]PAV26868.1 F0F1 ATP synthase subunit delta [Tamilnaduibacter salinus]